MMLTTKSRYAIMAIIEVASYDSNKPIRLADVSTSQDIPLSYLEQIFLKLKKAELVISVKGPGGGYQLKNSSDQITIENVIDAVEENLKMTKCGAGKWCGNNVFKCKTHDLWIGLGKQIRSYFGNISIADLISGEIKI